MEGRVQGSHAGRSHSDQIYIIWWHFTHYKLQTIKLRHHIVTSHLGDSDLGFGDMTCLICDLYYDNLKHLSVPCYFLAPCDKRKHTAHAQKQAAS